MTEIAIFKCLLCKKDIRKDYDLTFKLLFNHGQSKQFKGGGTGFKIKFSDDYCFDCSLETIEKSMPKAYEGKMKFSDIKTPGELKFDNLTFYIGADLEKKLKSRKDYIKEGNND